MEKWWENTWSGANNQATRVLLRSLIWNWNKINSVKRRQFMCIASLTWVCKDQYCFGPKFQGISKMCFPCVLDHMNHFRSFLKKFGVRVYPKHYFSHAKISSLISRHTHFQFHHPQIATRHTENYSWIFEIALRKSYRM